MTWSDIKLSYFYQPADYFPHKPQEFADYANDKEPIVVFFFSNPFLVTIKDKERPRSKSDPALTYMISNLARRTRSRDQNSILKTFPWLKTRCLKKKKKKKC